MATRDAEATAPATDKPNALPEPPPSGARPAMPQHIGLVSWLFFGWTSYIFKLGTSVTATDLPPVRKTYAATTLCNDLEAAWEAEQRRAARKGTPPSLVRAMNAVFGWRYIGHSLLFVAKSAFMIAQTQFLARLIDFFRDDSTASASAGYGYAAGILGCALGMAMLHGWFFYGAWVFGMQFRIATTTMVFNKVMALRLDALAEATAGKILNIVSTDVEKYQFLPHFFCNLFTAPLECAVILYFIYQEIGASGFAGAGVLVVFAFVQVNFSKLFGRYRRRLAMIADQRVGLTNQVVTSAKLLKMYAWEQPFASRVADARGRELAVVRRVAAVRAVNEALFTAAPLIIAVAAFLTFVYTGGELSPRRVFTSLALYNLLQLIATRQVPLAVQNASECLITSKRLEALLAMRNVQILANSAAPAAGATAAGGAGASVPADIVATALTCRWPSHHSAAPAAVSEQAPDSGSTGSAASAAGILADTALMPADASSATFLSVFVNGRWCTVPSSSPFSALLSTIRYRFSLAPTAQLSLRSGSATGPPVLGGADIEDGMTLHATADTPDGPFPVDEVASATAFGSSSLVLSDINLRVERGQMLAVVGETGSGKSSLLLALMQELPALSGTVLVHGRVGYVPQTAWIVNGSVRHNIVLENEFDADWYAQVVRACCLEHDLTSWSDGDRTEIGERGVNLSGGQKARVSLARAVYAKADVYLWDDPLSAVDAAVGRQLFERCLCDLLADKPRVLVTHQLQYLTRADSVLVLKAGRVTHRGSFEELAVVGGPLESVCTTDEEEVDDAPAGPKAEACGTDDMTHTGGLTSDEKLTKGVVTRHTYAAYFRAAGGAWVGYAVVFVLALGMASYVVSSWWLVEWSDQPPADQDDTYYTGTFVALVAVTAVLAFFRCYAFFRACLAAARNLHDSMFLRVARAPLWWFDANPVGRIINRFSKDVSLIDDLLPFNFYDFCQASIFCFAAVVASALATPLVLVLAAVFVVAVVYLRTHYIAGARQVKRLEALARSPVFSLLSAVLSGLTSVRAFGLQRSLTTEFHRRLDDNSRAYFMFFAASRWLGLRLDLASATFVGGVALCSVALRDSLSPGFVALGLSYLMSLSGIFQWTVRQSVEVEHLMVSVERVLEYADTPVEAVDLHTDGATSAHRIANWPTAGAISVRRLWVRYRPHLPPVLKGVSFDVPGGKKLGIVGRTGAGKSSLLLALFRLVEYERQPLTDVAAASPTPRKLTAAAPRSPSQVTPVAAGAGAGGGGGDDPCGIRIDGVWVHDVPLSQLRFAMSIIPQDPVLFEGTFRTNLDPFSTHDDTDLLNALEVVQLDAFVAERGGLHAPVAAGGGNISVGQAQLLCLARAVLRRSHVLVMDEPTANVDSDTDEKLQAAIRKAFASATVITVAHRLATVIDNDFVCVLADGEVAEFGPPAQLLASPDGALSKLVDETGAATAEKLRKQAGC